MDAAPPDVVVVLTRAPSSGGKTRLFAALGRPPDPALLAALLLDTIDGVKESGAGAIAAVTPEWAVGEVAALTGLPAIPQAEGDIGARMRRAMQDGFATGARRVAVVGSDLPELRGSQVSAAFAALHDDPGAVVLGPARDGGYYLIAAAWVPPVFDRIRWSGPDTLADTCAAAGRAGLHVVLTDPLADVDSVEDLQRLTAASPRSRAWADANGIARMRGSVT